MRLVAAQRQHSNQAQDPVSMFAPSHNDPSWHTTASSQWPSPQPDSHVAAIAPSGGVPPCTEHGYDDGSSTHSSVEPTSTNDSQVKVEDTGDLPEPDWPFSASDNDEDPSGSIENPTSLTDQHNLKQRIKRFRYACSTLVVKLLLIY